MRFCERPLLAFGPVGRQRLCGAGLRPAGHRPACTAQPCATSQGTATAGGPYLIALLLTFSLAAGAQVLPVRGNFKTDLSKRSIELSELKGGGPPKDGIPSIDNPQFISVSAAEVWLDEREPVMWLDHAGETRVYPLQILMYHELVNDRIGELPILVSYCPLCQSAIVFDRRVDGQLHQFGVSGMLRNSDMVMYDRTTESLWQQLTGEAIVGELTGEQLRVVTSRLTHFGAVKQHRPEARVLSRQTGVVRPYGTSPYVGYEFGSSSRLPSNSRQGAQIRPLDRLVVVRVGERAKAHPLELLARRVVDDGKIEGQRYVLFFDPTATSALDARQIARSRQVGSVGAFSPVLDGRALKFRERDGKIVDRATGSEWNVLGEAVSGKLRGERLEPVEHGVFYAFAWLAFRPDTHVVGLPPEPQLPPTRTPARPSRADQ